MADPFLNPADAFEPSTYEVTTPNEEGKLTRQNLVLMPHQDATLLGEAEYQTFYNRARKVWEATAQGDLVSPDFVLDLAQSPFDDDTILELAHARRRFLQDRSLFGRIRSIGAEPLDWLNNGVQFVFRNTVDKVAQWGTGDETATAADWAYIQLKGLGPQYQAGKLEGKSMSQIAGENVTGGYDAVLYMAASIVTDPTVFVPAAGQISKAGRIIRVGDKAARVGSKRGKVAHMLGFRTDPEIVTDVLRMGRGETPISAHQAWKSGRLSAYVKARMGGVPAERRVVEDLLLYGKTPGAMQSILPNTDINTRGLLKFLHEARASAIQKAGGPNALRTPEGFKAAFDSFVDDYASIFDGRLVSSLEPRLNALQSQADQIADALAGVDRVIDAAKGTGRGKGARGSALLERELIPRLSRQGFQGRAKDIAPFLRESLQTQLNAVSDQIGLLDDLGNTFGTQELLPKRRWTQAMRSWADHDPTVRFSEWDPPFRRVTAKLVPDKAKAVLARNVERFTAMNPHADIRVDSPTWPEQVRRLGQEYEFTLPNWTREHTEDLVTRALNVADDTELGALLTQTQTQAFIDLGLDEQTVTRLVQGHARRGGEITRNVLKGKGVGEALFSPQFLNNVAVMDPRLLRQTARRLQLKQSGKLGEFTAKQLKRLDDNDVSSILDAVNGTWKSLAAARPAYLFRVVVLSEVGRMTAAGGVTPLGSPLAWLNASFPGRGGRIAGKYRKTFEELGVPEIKAWDDLEDFLPEDWNLKTFMEAVRGVKAPDNLGAQFAPQRMTAFLNHADIEGTGVTKLADLAEHQHKLYRKAWLQLLRKDIAPDPLVQQFLRPGRSVEEAIQWLRTEGRTYAAGKGLNIADPKFESKARAFLAKQREVFDDMTRGNRNVIDRLDDLTLNELMDLDPPAALPINIAGKYAGLQGPEIAAKVVNESVLGKMWDAAGWFSHQVSRKGPYRNEFVRQVARQAFIAKKAGGSVNIKRVIAAAAQDGKGLNASERAVYNAARANAERFVKQTVYDLAETARWTDLARFISPFSNAWQEELTRWAMIAMNRPGTAGFMYSSMRAAQENPSFTWTDPQSGRDYLMLPFGDRITQFATGKWNPFTKGDEGTAFPLMIGWDNLNVLNAGGAFGVGFGPWLSVPAEVAASLRPEWRRGLSAVFPMMDGKVVDDLIPSAFYRAYEELNNDQTNARNIQTVAGYWAQFPQDERPPNEVIRNQARGITWLNVALALGIGGGARAQLPGNVQAEVDFIRDIQEVGGDLTDRVYLEAGRGEALAAWTTSYFEAAEGNPSGPRTEEAVEWLLNDRMKELKEKYPDAFWAISQEMLPEVQQFDPIEVDRQIRNNELNVRNLDQFMDAVNVRIGWAKYGLILDAQEQALTELGITSKSAQAAEPIRLAVERAREALFVDNPDWKDAYDDWSDRAGDRERRIEQMFQAINEPEFAPSPVAAYLKEYQGLRSAVTSAMATLDYKSLDTEQAFGLRSAWLQANQVLLARYPALRPFYERNLRFDTLTPPEVSDGV